MNELTFYLLIILTCLRIIGLGISADFYHRTRKNLFKILIFGWIIFILAVFFVFIADFITLVLISEIFLLTNAILASISLVWISMGILSYFIDLKLKNVLVISAIISITPLILYSIVGLKIAIFSSSIFMFAVVIYSFCLPLFKWHEVLKKIGSSVALHITTIIIIGAWVPISIFISSRGFSYGLYTVNPSDNFFVFLNYLPAIIGNIFLIILLIHLEYGISDQKLSSSEEKYRLIAENANDLISIHNQKFESEYVNEIIHKKVLQYSSSDLLNKPLFEYIHPDQLDQIKKEMSTYIEKGEGLVEIKFRKKDGTYAWLECKGKRYLDNEKEIKYLIISRDIGERKALEEARTNYTKDLEREVEIKTKELKKETSQLQETLIKLKSTQDHLIESEKLASIGLLAAGIAHEINNPLTGIINYADIIIEDLKIKNNINLDKLPYTFLNELISECNRISEVIQGLLAFSRQEKGEFTRINIIDLINSVLLLLKTKLKRDQIIVQLNMEENLPKILVREQKIKQVLINLINNSIDAMNEKFMENREFKKQISIEASSYKENDKDYIQITIIDNGMGILEDNLKNVFDPFFTTKLHTNEKGVGLGLSISYGIIKDHGGQINIESKWKEYTKVKVILPTSSIEPELEDK